MSNNSCAHSEGFVLMCKRLRENPSLNGRIDRLHRNITAWPNTVLASFDLAPSQPRRALRSLGANRCRRPPRCGIHGHVTFAQAASPETCGSPDDARSGGPSDRHLLPDRHLLLTGPVEKRPAVDRHHHRLIVAELRVAAQFGLSLAQRNDLHGR
jgi:hypothetical protein